LRDLFEVGYETIKEFNDEAPHFAVIIALLSACHKIEK
jgi:hypothetical protein